MVRDLRTYFSNVFTDRLGNEEGFKKEKYVREAILFPSQLHLEMNLGFYERESTDLPFPGMIIGSLPVFKSETSDSYALDTLIANCWKATLDIAPTVKDAINKFSVSVQFFNGGNIDQFHAGGLEIRLVNGSIVHAVLTVNHPE